MVKNQWQAKTGPWKGVPKRGTRTPWGAEKVTTGSTATWLQKNIIKYHLERLGWGKGEVWSPTEDTGIKTRGARAETKVHALFQWTMLFRRVQTRMFEAYTAYLTDLFFTIPCCFSNVRNHC
ncbi:hypothetical protein Y1Q_0020021 [Alligator mississippiensis]|uniref:Uncharacterized protein n=1 Tax=Alligator mississippiensis TaxID=8496 RepID=A0A151LYR8_ALLMI|nr:hypothetical protein Y1Q_0020021 [Alligator mississippiensis]